MVLMNGSKHARNSASLINLPTGGGIKKAGIPYPFSTTARVAFRVNPPPLTIPNPYPIALYGSTWKGSIGSVGIKR